MGNYDYEDILGLGLLVTHCIIFILGVIFGMSL